MLPLLCIDDVSVGYGEKIVIKDFSLTVNKGDHFLLLGPNGSGKTTLLSLIAGLDEPKSGKIYFNGEDVEKMGLAKYRRNAIAIVFQQYNLISYLTAAENVMVAMEETDNKVPKDKKEVAYNLLEKFGIVRTKADRMVGQLSGGEQQRVAIARSLASNVNWIFADEPTGNLDTATEKEIIDVFKDLAHNFGKTIIVVTHSDEVARMSDKCLLLKDGKLNNLN